jgi:hypothetical protein
MLLGLKTTALGLKELATDSGHRYSHIWLHSGITGKGTLKKNTDSLAI